MRLVGIRVNPLGFQLLFLWLPLFLSSSFELLSSDFLASRYAKGETNICTNVPIVSRDCRKYELQDVEITRGRTRRTFGLASTRNIYALEIELNPDTRARVGRAPEVEGFFEIFSKTVPSSKYRRVYEVHGGLQLFRVRTKFQFHVSFYLPYKFARAPQYFPNRDYALDIGTVTGS